MSKTLGIAGAGDFGRQIAHYALSDHHYNKVVFFDDSVSQDALAPDIRILGGTSAIEREFEKGAFDEMIIGIGYKHLPFRRQLFERISGKIPLGRIIHSACWVDKTASIGAGCVLYPGCCVDARVKIESNTTLNLACTVAHDTQIGKHCFLSPRVAVAGFVVVNEMCMLGINATVIDNVKLCANTRIGGGSLVLKDVPSPGLYVGSPIRFIRE